MKKNINISFHFCTILGSHFVVFHNEKFNLHQMIRISKNTLRKSVRMYGMKKSENSNKDFKFWHPK